MYFFKIFSGIEYKSARSPSTRCILKIKSSREYSLPLKKDLKSTSVFSYVDKPISNIAILLEYCFISLVVLSKSPAPVIVPRIIGFKVTAPAIVPAVTRETEMRLTARLIFFESFHCFFVAPPKFGVIFVKLF